MSSPWIGIATETLLAAGRAGLFNKLVVLLRRKKKILVLGASGVGKTQFIRSLKYDIVKSIPSFERSTFTDNTKVIIQNLPFLFIDAPGHIAYKQTRMKAIQMAIKNKVSGIINVVCYGYHEGIAKAIDAIDEAGIAKSEYLEKSRQNEIKQLSEWVQWVDKDVADWVITVVTKADLWWPDEDRKIQTYYENGLYHKKLGDFPVSVQHVVLPFCSIIEPFYGHCVSSRFGNEIKQGLHNRFLRVLLTAVR